MGVPFFYVLALIAGIGEMIPIVGPILSAVPAIAVALSVKPALALGVIVFFFAQQQLENHLLVPKIMQRQVGISPVFVIIALLIGGSLLGVIGAILAVPTAAILQVVFQEIVTDGRRGMRWRRDGAGASRVCGRWIYHRRARIDLAARRGLTRDVAWDLGDSVLNMWILSWDCRAAPRRSSAVDYSNAPTFLRCEHLLSGPADARVLGASRSAGAPDLSGLCADGNPILCYNLLFLSTFVLSGLGMFLLPRAHWQHRGGVYRRLAVRIRALSDSAVVAPAGAVFAVDAICAVRVPALLQTADVSARWPARAAGIVQRIVLRVLPAVFLAVRGAVRAVGDVATSTAGGIAERG